jgi:hypothetical protein
MQQAQDQGGEDQAQALYTEYDHIRDALVLDDGTRRVPFPGDANFPVNGIVTFTIGGSTFSYDLNTVPGRYAFDHAVIHGDVVTGWGSADTTGSLNQAIVGIPRKDAAGNVLTPLTGGPNGTAKDFNSTNKAAAGSTSLSTPAVNFTRGNCRAANSSATHKMNSRVRPMAVRHLTDVFDDAPILYYVDVSPDA